MAGPEQTIGSPLQGAGAAPADPLAGSAAPTGDDYASILANAGVAQGERADSGRLVTSENAFELAPVPGYPSLSVSAYQKQFLASRPADVLRLQRALVGAGYLRKEDIQGVGDGFDHATRQALGWLLEDSVFSGYRPRDILGYRMKVKAGVKPGQLQLADEMAPEDWKRQMADAYTQTWKQPAPPGYLDQFQNMNPNEFAAYERAKVTWEQSGVAEDERKELASALAQHFNQPRNVPGQQAGGGF